MVVAMTGRAGAPAIFEGAQIDVRLRRVETPDRQQDLQRHVAVAGFDESVSVKAAVSQAVIRSIWTRSTRSTLLNTSMRRGLALAATGRVGVGTPFR